MSRDRVGDDGKDGEDGRGWGRGPRRGGEAAQQSSGGGGGGGLRMMARVGNS